MKKNYILLVMLGILILSVPGFGQKKKSSKKETKENTEDQYSYQILRNDPEHGKNLSFIFDPFYVDVNDVNLNLGWALGVNYCYDNKFGISAKYYKAYLEPNPRPMYVTPVGTVAPFSNFEANASYIISSETRGTEEPITVKQEGRINYYINIPGKMLTTKLVRLGYMHINTFASGNIAYSGYDVADPAKTVVELDNFGSVMDESIIFIGYSRTKSHDMLAKFKNFGEKGSSSSTGFYADLMFAPSITYGDAVEVYKGGGPDKYVTYHVNEATPKFPLGARIGLITNPLGTVDWNAGIEGGIRPAPDVAAGLYILIHVGLSVNVKV